MPKPPWLFIYLHKYSCINAQSSAQRARICMHNLYIHAHCCCITRTNIHSQVPGTQHDNIHICIHAYIQKWTYWCRVAGDHIPPLLLVTMGVVTPLLAVILHITRGGMTRGGMGSRVMVAVTNIVSLCVHVCEIQCVVALHTVVALRFARTVLGIPGVFVCVHSHTNAYVT